MKEIKKEVTHEIKESITQFEARDGTCFNSREECRKYEESALGVMRGRVKDYIVGTPTDAWILMGGCDDHTVVGFKLPTEGAVDVFLQFLFLECPWYLIENHEERKAEVMKTVITAYKNNDVILMGQNCENDYYFINSRQNIIDNLMNLDKKEEETDV